MSLVDNYKNQYNKLTQTFMEEFLKEKQGENLVKGESMSAGRLYDKIVDMAEGTILYVTEHGIICYVKEGK